MAKTFPSRKAVQAAPQSRVHSYIPALVADDFGRMSMLTTDTANGFARKKLDAASQRLQLRAEQKAQRDEHRAYIIAENGLRLEFLEAEQQRRSLRRFIRTRAPRDRITRHKPPKKRDRTWIYAAEALPKYSGVILDRRGERSVFVRIRYYSRKTAGQGVSQRVVAYVFHGAEVDDAGRPFFVSNVGQDIDEALCAFDHLEQVNWSAQKNAKLLMHAIMAADYRQTPEQMMRCGLRWAEETLGRFGLPYVVTLHAPSPEGDERNWHFHVLFSFRPMARIGDHAWEVGEMLRTDLDNPQAMRLMREMFAAVMTDTSFEAGHNQVYTAKSNAARGLVHEPQAHLGGMLTSMARNGHHIAKNEENFERVIRSETAQLDEGLRHVDEALAREQELVRSIARRWVRLPVIPRQIPQRIVATVLNAEMPVIAMPLPPLPAPVVIPDIELPVRVDATIVPMAIASVAMPARAAPLEAIGADVLSVPARPATPVAVPSLKIANLRLPVRQAPTLAPLPEISVPAIASLARMPTIVGAVIAPPRIAPSRHKPPIALPQPPSVPVVRMPSLRNIPAALPQAPTVPNSPAALPAPMVSVQAPPVLIIRPAVSLFDAGSLGLAIERVDGALETYKLREAERAETEKVRQMAAARLAEEERRRLAVQRLMTQIIAERRAIKMRDGKRRVEAELLARHGLEEADIAMAEAQAQLERIAEDRAAEIAAVAKQGRAAAALPASVTPAEDMSSGHSLATWLRSARHADRIAAKDDDDAWPRRRHGGEARSVGQQAEAALPRRLPVTPRGLDR